MIPGFSATKSSYVDLNLSKRLERAEALANRRFIEAKQIAFPGTDAAWIEVAGAYAMYDTAQSPLTQTFGLGVFEQPTDDDFERIEKFFVDRGAPVYHEISPVPDQSLLGKLRERRYYPVELTNILYRTIDDDWEVEANPAFKVRQIGPGEQEAYCKLCAQAWQLPAEFAPFFEELAKVSERNEHVASFVVEHLGQPIGAGGLCLSDDVALIAGDCTLPEARGKGAQLALLAARVKFARELGYDLMMMGALPGSTSQKNGQRAGMNIAYTRIKWTKAPIPCPTVA
jgi:GNAT superfamily N-acetyltransferase